MEKLTKTQMELVAFYILILIVFLLLGLILSKRERGLGALVGVNIGITVVSALWLWKGQTAWKKKSITPIKTKAPSS